MGKIQYGIIILSLTLFLIPISQADAIFKVPTEITDDEFSKNYNEQQRLMAEKIRDYYFEKYLRIQNPYNDNISDEKTIFDEEKFYKSSQIDRYDETFQMLKNEQLDLAQIKYLEILGGKIITNSFDNHDKRIIPTLKFTDEEEKIRKTIHRDDEDFKNYKIKQIILAENTVKKLIEEEIWEEDPFIIAELFEDYYNSGKDVESVSAAFDLINEGVVTAEELIKNEVISPEDLIQDNVISASNLKLFWMSYKPVENTKTNVQETLPEKDDFDWKNIEWKKSSRASQEFQNLIAEQILSAENTRDEKLTLLPNLNPYEENNETVITHENNQTEITPEIFVELEPIINRLDEKFQEYQLKQIEKAELFFKNYYRMENLDEDNISDPLIQKQLILQKTDDKNDMFLKLKEFENKKAREKILEIFGGKNIYN